MSQRRLNRTKPRRPVRSLIDSSEKTAETTWLVVVEGFNLAQEHEVESLLAIGNGYLGTRAALHEGSPLSFPGTFVAGVYDRRETGSPPELAVAPDWRQLRNFVEGRQARLDPDEPVEHRRVLDMRQGLLRREWLHRDSTGRETRITILDLASLDDRHLMMQSLTLTPLNYAGRIVIEAPMERPSRHLPSGTDGIAELLLTPPPALSPAPPLPGPHVVLEFRTRQGDVIRAASAGRKLQQRGCRTGRGGLYGKGKMRDVPRTPVVQRTGLGCAHR